MTPDDDPDGQPEQSAAGTPQTGRPANGGNTPSASKDSSGSGTPQDVDVLVTEAIRTEVADALYLADFAVKTGFKKADGRTLGIDTLQVIKVMAGKVQLFEPQNTGTRIKASDWTSFELAYYSLADFTNPVTAETLRNTEDTGKGFRKASSAQQFTWLLWAITGLFAIFVIFAAGVASGGLYASDIGTWTDTLQKLNTYLQILTPYAYGGLGACAYLLRSAHSMIYQRSFDIRRKPEYFNRIALGMVSGGAITLFVSQLTDDDGNVIRLGSAALGFIAGYSNDFLFNTIERVVAAILPRVGLESVQRAAPAPTRPPMDLQAGGLTLKELMTRMDGAKEEDKALYRSLIEKLRDRL
jgi:hypothetical protein